MFLKELMRASESSSIHLPYGDKKFWLNAAKCAVIYHSGGGIVSRKNNPPSGSKGEKKGKKKNVIFDKMMEVSKLQLKMEIAMR